MNINELVKDNRKMELLENRLAGKAIGSPQTVATTSAFTSVATNIKPMDSSISTLLDASVMGSPIDRKNDNDSGLLVDMKPIESLEQQPVQQQGESRAIETEIIEIDSNSRSRPLPPKGQDDLPVATTGSKRIRSDEDSRSQQTRDSFEGSLDRAPVRAKMDEFDHNSPTPGDGGSRGAPVVKNVRPITSYFPSSNSEGMSLFAVSSDPAQASSALGTAAVSKTAPKKKDPKENKEVAVANAANSISELKKQLEQAKASKDSAEFKANRLEAEMKVYHEKAMKTEERSNKVSKALEEVHRLMAMQEFRRKRDRIALDCVRLGKISSFRTGAATIGEVWEDGYAWKELHKRSAELLERKEELESRKRKVQNMRRQAKRAGEENDDTDELDLVIEQEAVRYHFDQLKKDEVALAEERRLLESEKAIHQKELRRCQCEERSRFYRDLPCLHARYLLQYMLGKGGFSEVWKALDLQELRDVAVKIHQLNPQWSEERKQSYIRHVTREYNIHKDMKHPRVVQLFDVFEIDVNSFATVLEFCKGIDLDEKLKRQKTIPEKDAKVIFMQIMSGLRYLNKPHGEESSNKRISIIHFDLKPANILFDEMDDVKITDFGLSKIIDETNDGTTMELTSQGAGTYWYLPPECFAKGPNPPRISSKVDVWSAGVIFFQMLYGFRPFGEGKTQESVWSENIILNAVSVEFPSDPRAPKVSDEAKDLIRQCLTRDQRLRPDVVQVCQHPYLKSK